MHRPESAAREVDETGPGAAGAPPEADELLMARVAVADREAYAELVSRFLGPLTWFGQRLLSKPEEAEDLVQETFLRLWTHAHQWQPGRGKVTTWLHTIMHNLCIDHHRRDRSDTSGELDKVLEAGATPDGTLAEDDRARAIHLALAALPERQRSAIVLCHFQGFSNRDAAEVIGVSVDALESLMARGRRAMRERLNHLAQARGEE